VIPRPHAALLAETAVWAYELTLKMASGVIVVNITAFTLDVFVSLFNLEQAEKRLRGEA